jgi:hypothetical protein
MGGNEGIEEGEGPRKKKGQQLYFFHIGLVGIVCDDAKF